MSLSGLSRIARRVPLLNSIEPSIGWSHPLTKKGDACSLPTWQAKSGRGAIEHLAQITGMSPNTIRRGLADLKQPLRIPPTEYASLVVAVSRSKKKDPAVIQALENLLQDVTAGDPTTGMKWTHKSIRRLCRTLRRQGFSIGRGSTVRRLLHQRKYCLRTYCANGWLGHTTRIGPASFDTWSVSDIAI